MIDPSEPPPSPLPFAPGFGPLPRAELLALIRSDQRLRWRRGERVAAEAYVERLPFLRHDRDALLDLVVAEIELRAEAGEPFDGVEYRTRFPELAGPLIWRFALHRAAVGSVLSEGEGQVTTVAAPPKPRPVNAAPATIDQHVPVEPASGPLPSLPDPQATALRRLHVWSRRHRVIEPYHSVAAGRICEMADVHMPSGHRGHPDQAGTEAARRPHGCGKGHAGCSGSPGTG